MGDCVSRRTDVGFAPESGGSQEIFEGLSVDRMEPGLQMSRREIRRLEAAAPNKSLQPTPVGVSLVVLSRESGVAERGRSALAVDANDA
jgi:hypothetical protein